MWYEALQNRFIAVAKRLDQSPESFAKDYAGLKKGDILMQKRMFHTGGLSMMLQKK